MVRLLSPLLTIRCILKKLNKYPPVGAREIENILRKNPCTFGGNKYHKYAKYHTTGILKSSPSTSEESNSDSKYAIKTNPFHLTIIFPMQRY